MIILGIETSCDETAASVIKTSGGKIEILSNIISSQIPIHRKYGGIIPEIAARAHIENILPVIQKSLEILKNKKIDLIAVTQGPGLVTSLLVGIETAKTFSYAKKIPLMGINHLKGHICANFINNEKIKFPALCLIVSGGHTELILMSSQTKYKKIGQTRDDAAGECFDKIAKLLNIGYPGGPAIAAKAAKPQTINQKLQVSLPRPMFNSPDFDFSFSGLKTAVFYLVQKNKNILTNDKTKNEFIQAVCAEAQQSIIDVLIKKTLNAGQKFKVKSIVLCGGVASNNELRKQFEEKIKNLTTKIDFHVPERKLCTDNAVMIATAAYLQYKNMQSGQIKKLTKNFQAIKVNPNLEI
ncbi:MAG: tRNA (adenosine(37)-N6)-threonylcarbamoyltransferase complex transferase subunit TsaD [Patescibacteria group bacterium]|nr:tRNA (adenosine(37)-N6)-threonylcarbamoyltransferase complex transferase subunit TsaD [Patescibacteria group bacterium]MDD5164440.1 tRNA (adenosine(37)-N6)-threonylcarbamoyltransferase complex transferase subunit TsaD [Patescibacteria group bacterium]MDD5534359.1 tRNA (adenosine(37)-N6)-threonylcarbamoyltransferase complex transferase subunit TsaD [Patescibacteria group bacterium]